MIEDRGGRSSGLATWLLTLSFCCRFGSYLESVLADVEVIFLVVVAVRNSERVGSFIKLIW